MVYLEIMKLNLVSLRILVDAKVVWVPLKVWLVQEPDEAQRGACTLARIHTPKFPLRLVKLISLAITTQRPAKNPTHQQPAHDRKSPEPTDTVPQQTPKL